MSMEINFTRYSYVYVLDILEKISPQFTPALSDSLDLYSYAEKLAKNATFLTNRDNNKLVGVIVFYPNKLTSIIYIPLVWVENSCRGQGIAKKMFEYLICNSKNEDFLFIDLEVLKNNTIATKLYLSLGFQLLEDRNNKILMRLSLKKDL